MKKLLFLVFAFLAVINLNAQQREKGTFELTPYAGFSAYNLSGDETDGLQSRAGLALGAHLDYYFNDRWSFRSGVNYMPMGVNGSNGDLRLNYLAIPVNANWHFGSTRKWNLNFGLSPSFLMGSSFDGNDNGDQIESFQLVFTYGIGYKLFVNEKFSILFDIQNHNGLTNILTTDEFSNTTFGGSFNVGGVFNF